VTGIKLVEQRRLGWLSWFCTAVVKRNKAKRLTVAYKTSYSLVSVLTYLFK